MCQRGSYDISEHKDGYLLTVHMDMDFLNDSDTAYPVVLDPTVYGSSTFDGYIIQGTPTNSLANKTSYLGMDFLAIYDTNHGKEDSLVNIDHEDMAQEHFL